MADPGKNLAKLVGYGGILALDAASGGLSGFAGQALVGIAGNVVANSWDALFDHTVTERIANRLQGSGSILDNGDLSAAVGRALVVIIQLQAETEPDPQHKKLLKQIAQKTIEGWAVIVERESLQNGLKTLQEANLGQIWIQDPHQGMVLPPEVWTEIVESLSTRALKGMLPKEVQQRLISSLNDRFAKAFREVLKEDFVTEGGGRAYAALLLDMVGGIQKTLVSQPQTGSEGLAAPWAQLEQRLRDDHHQMMQELSDRIPKEFTEFAQTLGIKIDSMQVFLVGIQSTLGGIQDDTQRILEDTGKISQKLEELAPSRLAKDLTAQIPKLDPIKIVGRERDLDDLHQRLFAHKQVVLVNGLGGIGKTTLAQAYVGKFYEIYAHIAWISQLSDSFVNDVVNTAGLMLSLQIDRAGKDPGQLFTEIIMCLKSIDQRPCLWVIDNADASLAHYVTQLPSQPQWHILTTSRGQIEGFELKELGFLSESESVELFLRHYKLKQLCREDIVDLVRSVDFHTLTIEILAKTAQQQRIGFEVLKQALKSDQKANVQLVSQLANAVTTLREPIFEEGLLNQRQTHLNQNSQFFKSV